MEYGSGKYTYTLVESWAKLPKEESLVDVTGISIDSNDKVYVFNRSKRPMIVFDRNGNEIALGFPFRESFGEHLDIGVAQRFGLESRLMAQRALEATAIEDQQLAFVFGQLVDHLVEEGVGNIDRAWNVPDVEFLTGGTRVDQHDVIASRNNG